MKEILSCYWAHCYCWAFLSFICTLPYNFGTNASCAHLILKAFTESKIGIFNRTSTTTSVSCVNNYGPLAQPSSPRLSENLPLEWENLSGATMGPQNKHPQTSAQVSLSSNLGRTHTLALLSPQDVVKALIPKPLWDIQLCFSLLRWGDERMQVTAKLQSLHHCGIQVSSHLVLGNEVWVTTMAY